MAVYTIPNLIARIDQLIYTNGEGAITALIENGLLKDIIDSLEALIPAEAAEYDGTWIQPAINQSIDNLKNGVATDGDSLLKLRALIADLDTAKQDSLGFTAENVANRGVLYASLVDGKVPALQLPAYVDDVLEYTNFAALPATGASGLIYVTLDDNKQYRWSGTGYQIITASPGSSDAVPEGATNKYFTEARVLASIIANISVATNAPIANGDSLLVALGKIQAQINSKVAQVAGSRLITTPESNKIGNLPTDTNAEISGIKADILEIQTNPPGVISNTDSLTEGATNKYFTESRVRSALLTGISFLTSNTIAATDTALVAWGKLQAQITALTASVTTQVSAAITTLRGGVPTDGDTLKKLNDKIIAIQQSEHYRGTFSSLVALKAAIPVGAAGNEALIDAGVGSQVQKAIWDTTDNDWFIAAGGSITTDANPTNGSINAVQSGGTYAALANKVDKNGTDRLLTATEGTKLSGIEAYANNYSHPANHSPSIISQDAGNRFVTDTEKTTWNGKANKIASPTISKIWKSDANGQPVESTLTDAQLMTVASVNVADIAEGQTKVMTVQKQVGTGLPIQGEGVGMIDSNVSSAFDTLLADSAAWVYDLLTLTGNNLIGALGNNAQRHQMLGNIYVCTSHVTGTTTSNGSATWVRCRSNDCLMATNTQDALVITALETESGWNSDNAKVITVRSKVGSWYIAGTGYLFKCYSESGTNWYWRRVGSPVTDVMQITDATLKAEIEANNFSTNPMLNPVATVKGTQGQLHAWESPTGTPNAAIMLLFGGSLRWIKFK